MLTVSSVEVDLARGSDTSPSSNFASIHNLWTNLIKFLALTTGLTNSVTHKKLMSYWNINLKQA